MDPYIKYYMKKIIFIISYFNKQISFALKYFNHFYFFSYIVKDSLFDLTILLNNFFLFHKLPVNFSISFYYSFSTNDVFYSKSFKTIFCFVSHNFFNVSFIITKSSLSIFFYFVLYYRNFIKFPFYIFFSFKKDIYFCVYYRYFDNSFCIAKNFLLFKSFYPSNDLWILLKQRKSNGLIIHTNFCITSKYVFFFFIKTLYIHFFM